MRLMSQSSMHSRNPRIKLKSIFHKVSCISKVVFLFMNKNLVIRNLLLEMRVSWLWDLQMPFLKLGKELFFEIKIEHLKESNFEIQNIIPLLFQTQMKVINTHYQKLSCIKLSLIKQKHNSNYLLHRHRKYKSIILTRMFRLNRFCNKKIKLYRKWRKFRN